MKEEVRKVLDMLEKGQLNASQASELLDAMEAFQDNGSARTIPAAKRMLRIKILSADGDKVNLKVPASLVGASTNVAQFFAGRSHGKNESMKDVDWGQLSATVSQMLEDGSAGEIVNIESEDGDKVLIWLE